MDKALLEKSSDITPLLVRLHDRHSMYALAKEKSPESRSELSNIMVDLLEIELSAREKELIADVIISLTRQAEKDLKQALALRLAGSAKVPLRVVLQLANDEIEIAEPVLRLSPVLHDMDLVYIIKSKGPEHWQAIAKRAGLNPAIINILAETRDEETAISLSENDSIFLTDQAITIFIEMCKHSERLAKPLLMRDEIPGIIGQVLYEQVGEEIKAIIRERFPMDIGFVEEQINDIVLEFVEPKDTRALPSVRAVQAAQALAERNEIKFETLISSLRLGQIGSFAALFAEYCHLPQSTVQEMLRQETGQGLAIACKAKGISKADFITMFLLTQKLRGDGTRIVKHQEMTKASAYYDKVTEEMARKILESSRN